MESLYTIITESGCTHEACKPTRRSNSGLVLLEATTDEQHLHLVSHGYTLMSAREIMPLLDISDWQADDM